MKLQVLNLTEEVRRRANSCKNAVYRWFLSVSRIKINESLKFSDSSASFSGMLNVHLCLFSLGILNSVLNCKLLQPLKLMKILKMK